MPLPGWLSAYLSPIDARAWGAEKWASSQSIAQIITSSSDIVLRPSAYYEPILILRSLGEGGMGATFKVVEWGTGAIRVCKAPQPGQRLDRFDEEMRILSRIKHPNIVEFQGRLQLLPIAPGTSPWPAFLMEYVAGGSLAQLLKHQSSNGNTARRAVPLGEALRILAEIVDGLDALHQQNVRHRDLKPENVLLDVQQGRTVKLCDFGIAKDELQNLGLTPAGSKVPGTLAYCAPEVIVSTISDYRADYFSAGCIASEMLSGHQTFVPNNEYDFGVTSREVPRGLDVIEREYGQPTLQLVASLLHKNPADRTIDPATIHDAIKRILSEKRPSNQKFWIANWPKISPKAESQLRSYLFEDHRSFRYGRLPRIGTLVALHAERMVLIDFQESLILLHRRLWLTLGKLGSPLLNLGGSDSDIRLSLGQALDEFDRNCEELLRIASDGFPGALRRRMELVDENQRLYRIFDVIYRRALRIWERKRPLPPQATRADLENERHLRLGQLIGVWRSWLELQDALSHRVRECSDQLTVCLAGIQ